MLAASAWVEFVVRSHVALTLLAEPVDLIGMPAYGMLWVGYPIWQEAQYTAARTLFASSPPHSSRLSCHTQSLFSVRTAMPRCISMLYTLSA